MARTPNLGERVLQIIGDLLQIIGHGQEKAFLHDDLGPERVKQLRLLL